MKNRIRAALLAGVSVLVVAPALTAPVQAEDWSPSQITPTTLPLRWSRALLTDQVSLDALGRRPVVDGNEETWMLACERDDQLDCIESIGMVSAGVYSPGKMTRAFTFDAGATEWYPARAMHETTWNLPGLVVDGQEAKVKLTSMVGSPGMRFGLEVDGSHAATPGGLYGCRSLVDGECLNEPPFPDGTVLRAVVRTSWLAPHGAFVRARGASVVLEDLGNGAHRISVTGEPMMLQSQNSNELIAGIPQWVHSTFDFQLYDNRLGHELGGDCTVNHPIVVSGNGSESGLPSWDANTGQLKLQMQAPHFWSDGVTEWLGFYASDLPAQAVQCMWGIDPSITNGVTVSVLDSSGQAKAATTSVAYQEGFVKIRAEGFTFSANDITAKLKVKRGTRCYSQGVRVTGLSCKRHKVVVGKGKHKHKVKRLVWVKTRR